VGHYRNSYEETLDHECRREKPRETLSLHLQEGIEFSLGIRARKYDNNAILVLFAVESGRHWRRSG